MNTDSLWKLNGDSSLLGHEVAMYGTLPRAVGVMGLGTEGAMHGRTATKDMVPHDLHFAIQGHKNVQVFPYDFFIVVV